MEYLVTVKVSTPEYKIAEVLADLDECLYCETVTGGIDAIAKFSSIPRERFKGVRFYNVEGTIKVLKSKESAVPFWWCMKSKTAWSKNGKTINDVVRPVDSITECYAVKNPFNLWLRGSVKNTSRLSDLQDRLFSPLGC